MIRNGAVKLDLFAASYLWSEKGYFTSSSEVGYMKIPD